MASAFSNRISNSCIFSCAHEFEFQHFRFSIANESITASGCCDYINRHRRRVRLEGIPTSKVDEEIQCFLFKHHTWLDMGLLAFPCLPDWNGHTPGYELLRIFTMGYFRNSFYQLDLLLYHKCTNVHTCPHQRKCRFQLSEYFAGIYRKYGHILVVYPLPLFVDSDCLLHL